jgi:hypothetical protein
MTAEPLFRERYRTKLACSSVSSLVVLSTRLPPQRRISYRAAEGRDLRSKRFMARLRSRRVFTFAVAADQS